MTWPELLTLARKARRLAIAGGPRVGKTTLASLIADGRHVIHTDDFISLGWSEASAHAAKLVNHYERSPLNVTIEGVAVPRALRKGMKVDLVIWLSKAREPLSSGQMAMTKACRSVLDEWRRASSTPVIEFEAPDAPHRTPDA